MAAPRRSTIGVSPRGGAITESREHQIRSVNEGLRPGWRAVERRVRNERIRLRGPAPYERLDEVSDYDRIQLQNDELWKTIPASEYAVVGDGKVKGVVITEAGSGYSSPPIVAIMGMEKVPLKAILHFDKELRRNGSVESVEVAGQKPGR